MKLMQKMVMATTTLALLLGISLVPVTNASALDVGDPNRYPAVCGTGYAWWGSKFSQVGFIHVYNKGYYFCAIHERTDGMTKYTGISLQREGSSSYQSSVRYSYRTDPVYSYVNRDGCALLAANHGTSAAPHYTWNAPDDTKLWRICLGKGYSIKWV